jgi:hypothetical protein
MSRAKKRKEEVWVDIAQKFGGCDEQCKSYLSKRG